MQVPLLQLLLLHSLFCHDGSFYNICCEAGYSPCRHMQSPPQIARFVSIGVLWTYGRWLLYRCLLQLQLAGSAGVYFLLWIYQAGSHYLNWNVLQVPEYSVAPEPPQSAIESHPFRMMEPPVFKGQSAVESHLLNLNFQKN